MALASLVLMTTIMQVRFVKSRRSTLTFFDLRVLQFPTQELSRLLPELIEEGERKDP